MPNKLQQHRGHQNWLSVIRPRAATAALAVLGTLGLGLMATPPAKAQTLTVLHSFTNSGGDGEGPVAGLVMDASGNLYGTTQQGGASGYGTVFKLDSSNNETILHSFTYPGGDGYHPDAGLVMDASGNLYGTTPQGGASGYGTVFKLDTSNNETILHSFTGQGGGDGADPMAGLVMDASGNLYGTTQQGGAVGVGIVFKLDSSGNETILHSFTGSGGDGAYSYAGLVMDASGNLYGTTGYGGTSFVGIVFKLDSSGNETILHSFTGQGGGDGAVPLASLVMDASGNLYGTTQQGGASNYGTVFKLDSSGNETVLHSFTGSPGDGNLAVAGLILDALGNLYGATYEGGTSNYGTVFKVGPSGSSAVLYSFTNSGDGAYPSASLLADASGNLYGTTVGNSQGGPSSYGTVFKFTTPTENSAPTTATLTSSPNPADAGESITFTVTVTSSFGTPTGTVTFYNGATALGAQLLNSGQATFLVQEADALGVGTFAISAQYQPDTTGYASSASNTVSQTVTETGVALLNGNNTFSGNQTVNGTLTATSLSGSGAGLTSLNPANLSAGTAAISITGNAATATTASAAANASALGGIAPTSYARLDIGNSFNGNQTVTGNLTVTGNSATTGTVTIGHGGTPIIGHVSLTFNPKFPALKASACAQVKFTFTGASDGESLALGVPNERMTGTGTMIYTGWVSAANSVTIRACNISPTTAETTPGSGAIRVDLWQH